MTHHSQFHSSELFSPLPEYVELVRPTRHRWALPTLANFRSTPGSTSSLRRRLARGIRIVSCMQSVHPNDRSWPKGECPVCGMDGSNQTFDEELESSRSEKSVQGDAHRQ